MNHRDLIVHKTKQKALDHALWLTFKSRMCGHGFGAFKSPDGENGFLVGIVGHPSFDGGVPEPLPEGYSDISYGDIRAIRHDTEQLPHWEGLCGAFSVMDGELLRFILEYRVNLERFIRYELSARGHDKGHKWVGFERAKEIWLE